MKYFVLLKTMLCSTTEFNHKHIGTFTFINLADAFIQSDFQKSALQKCVGH